MTEPMRQYPRRVQPRESDDLHLDGGVAPEISMLIPVAEFAEPLAELYEEFVEPLRKMGRRFEVVFIATPQRADLLQPLERLAARGEPVRTVVSRRAATENALLRIGIEASKGATIVTVPAYRQVEASAIPVLLDRLEDGADVVVARRWPRRDALINRVQNRLLHLTVRGLTDDRIHDVACGMRAMRRETLAGMPLYGDTGRFLPLLAMFNGYRVVEVPATQHVRNMRGRVYSPLTYVSRAMDVLGLFFLLRFMDKPLRFFGLIGGLLVLIGGALLMALLLIRIGGTPIGQRPMLLLGAVVLSMGVQSVALGLIGELIVHFNTPGRRAYRLAREDSERDA
jgi:hypothetical protein